MKVFTVYDSKGEFFGQPFFLQSRGLAIRSFADVANDSNSQIGRFPADYTLFEIGEFDQSTGLITMLPAKISLGTALELKPQVPALPVPVSDNVSSLNV